MDARNPSNRAKGLIVRWGWLRFGTVNIGWWLPGQWRPFSVREKRRGRQWNFAGFTLCVWRNKPANIVNVSRASYNAATGDWEAQQWP